MSKINELAKECLEQTNGIWKDAAELLELKLQTDSELMRELLKPMLSKAVWTVITKIARDQRKPFFKTDVEEEEFVKIHSDSKGIEAVSIRSWYAYNLQGGVKLGDATKEDLDVAIEYHKRFAENNAKKAVWLSKIREMTISRVKDTVTEDNIKEFAVSAGLKLD